MSLTALTATHIYPLSQSLTITLSILLLSKLPTFFIPSNHVLTSPNALSFHSACTFITRGKVSKWSFTHSKKKTELVLLRRCVGCLVLVNMLLGHRLNTDFYINMREPFFIHQILLSSIHLMEDNSSSSSVVLCANWTSSPLYGHP